MAFDVFISYSNRDKTAADASCAALERAGIRCWIAPRDVLPGLEWDEAIVRAIDNCRVMLLIFSANANESRQIRREVKRAFNRGAPVVPLRIEAVTPTETMAYYMDSVHWLDALTPPLEQHLARLAEIVKAFLQTDGRGPLQTPDHLRDQSAADPQVAPLTSAPPAALARRESGAASGESTSNDPVAQSSPMSKRSLLTLGAAGAAASVALGAYGLLRVRTEMPGAITRDLPRSTSASVSTEYSTGASYRRVALVAGSANYASVPALRTSAADATAISEVLASAGFQTTSLLNATNLEFRRALRNFNDAASKADVAVFYYAGHGIEVSGTNYLVPVDAKLANNYDVEDEAVPLERVVSCLENTKRFRLIILDACRDNPFVRTMTRPNTTRSVTRGLAPVEVTVSDMLIAYAAKGGQTAADGDGSHSPYTTALLKHLPTPGLDVRLVFGRVRDDVLRMTARRQEPFLYGSLGGEIFSLVPLAPEARR